MSAPLPPDPIAQTVESPGKRRWRRGWLRPKTGSTPSTAAESDAVVTARLSRNITIATTLIAALVGITGTVTTAFLSYDQSSSQVAAEKQRSETEFAHTQQKSATEFIRTQRQKVYADFHNHLDQTFNSLLVVSGLLRSGSVPTLTEYNNDISDLSDKRDRLTDTGAPLILVATDNIVSLGDNEMKLLNAYVARMYKAGPYIRGDRPVDKAYMSISLTDEERRAFNSAESTFAVAVRAELSSTNPPSDGHG
jgi:hypothetical protein